jgi:hypothetical protein
VLLRVLAQKFDEVVHLVAHSQERVDQLCVRVGEQRARGLQQALDVKEDSPTAEEGFQVAADRVFFGIQGLELAQKLPLASSPFDERPEKRGILSSPERETLVGKSAGAERSAG